MRERFHDLLVIGSDGQVVYRNGMLGPVEVVEKGFLELGLWKVSGSCFCFALPSVARRASAKGLSCSLDSSPKMFQNA